MSFTLDPAFLKDSFYVAHLDNCQVRLHNNALYPWVVVIPEITGITEIFEIGDEYFATIKKLTEALKMELKADKMNVASFGNMVPQLHFHIIARYKTDKAWPKPTFGLEAKVYEGNEAAELIAKLQNIIAKL